jgi:hypothetical protein
MEGEEVYEGDHDHSTGDWGDGFWGSLGFAGRRVSSGVGRISSGAPVC